ncbi:MAG: amidohydrolase [Chloroflexi bacterium]|nr:amidohydrolase [Chloroflexota bacterium]
MPDIEIIDAHTHTYASREIGLRAKGDAATDGNTLGGTIEELEAAMGLGRIRRAVMLCLHPYADMREAAIAKIPATLVDAERAKAEADIEAMLLGRQQRRNQWTCEVAQQHGNLIPFITFDPSMPADTICAEIEERGRQGSKGIKLHASLGKFHPYDPRLFPAYDLAQERGLPVVFHGGAFFGGRGEYSRPKNFKEIATRFPRLTFALAHLGQGYIDEPRELAGLYAQVAFDCSAIVSSAGEPGGMPPQELVALVREVGVHRVQHGSDYPYLDPVRAAAKLLSLPFTADEQRLIAADNARRLLRLG